jgi:hypothetical protein
MATYNDLSPASYYLIQESENAGVELVYVPMVTGKAVLLEFQDEEQSLKWYKKSEELFEVVEQLTEEQAVIYESLFDEDDEEDDEDDDDFEWDGDDDGDDDGDLPSWFDDEDEEDDKKVRALHN